MKALGPLLLIVGCLTSVARNSAAADDGVKIGGSILGFVFDGNAKALRAIFGIPGSSLLGDPLNLNREINRAVTASPRDFGIAVTPDSDLLQISNLNATAVTRLLATGVLPEDTVRLSPSGTAAAIFRSAAARLQIYTGLPEEPALVIDADVSSLRGSLTALAASDDGAVALAGMADNENQNASVQLLDAAGNIRQLMALGRPSSIAFLRGSHSALIADTAANKVYLVRDVLGGDSAVAILSETDGIANPVAVESSYDKRFVVAANANSGTVVILDQTGGPPVSVPCFCAPTALARLTGNAVFRLNELSTGPLWLLDADAPLPRILFVPPRNEASQNASPATGGN